MDAAVDPRDPSTRTRRIDDSFGIASCIAVVGVLLGWWYIRWDAPIDVVTPIVPTQVASAPQAADTTRSPTERGDAAFARGDVMTPAGDNALYYYRQALAADPDDPDAARGVADVVEFLLNEAEAAIFAADWERAFTSTRTVLELEPGHADARELARRAERSQRIEELLNRAVALYAQGKLTAPRDENAAAMYQSVLDLDPDNATARQGLDSVVQRSIANAESALFAGRAQQAKDYLERARAIDPHASGLAALEQTERTMKAMQQSMDVKKDLTAAAEALQADRLMPPAEPNAFTLYQRVLARQPDSAVAQRGLELVRAGLIGRARTLLAANDMSATFEHLDAAERAGADPAELGDLRDEARYRQRLIDAEEGRFESLTPISALTPVRVDAPAYPRWGDGEEALVAVEMTVTVNGDVRDVVVTSEKSRFDSAAERGVRKWKFQPYMELGRPVPVRVAVKIRFKA